MNYRHAYHAGNHADVLKHVVVARLLEHLKKKDKPFRILDLHAGIGVYDFTANEAAKTGEWRDGVGRFYNEEALPLPLSDQVEELIAPWRAAIAAVNAPGSLHFYPGSPELALHVLRPSDRLMLNELHPEDFANLRGRYRRDRRVTLTELDAAVAIKAQLPPPERRGLVLIDPPYEALDEPDRNIRALRNGLERFSTGQFCLWYPITGDGLSDALAAQIHSLAIPRTLQVEMTIRAVMRDGGLAGSGLILVNPPWMLDRELELLLPELRGRLAQSPEARSRVHWLRAE
jgi:23S rRNA (adenine2030-N6)-methyltransferase